MVRCLLQKNRLTNYGLIITDRKEDSKTHGDSEKTVKLVKTAGEDSW